MAACRSALAGCSAARDQSSGQFQVVVQRQRMKQRWDVRVQLDAVAQLASASLESLLAG